MKRRLFLTWKERFWLGDKVESCRGCYGVIGLGIRKNGDEVITGSTDGVFRIWSCTVVEKSNIEVSEIDEEEEFAKDFTLSANGNRVF